MLLVLCQAPAPMSTSAAAIAMENTDGSYSPKRAYIIRRNVGDCLPPFASVATACQSGSVRAWQAAERQLEPW